MSVTLASSLLFPRSWHNFPDPVDVLLVAVLDGGCDDLAHVVRVVFCSWDAIYTCSIHYQMLLLSYFSQTLSAPPPGLFLFWSSSEPRNRFLSSPPTRTHSWSLTRENWYFQIYHPVLLFTWNDVDASRELVGHQPARNLLGHVAAGRRHEGHGEVLGLPVGRGHPGHRVQSGPRHTRHQVPRLAQDLWHQHQQGHGYLHTF